MRLVRILTHEFLTSTASSAHDAGRYRNDCGVGGEDCSLCMVSSIASSYWVRWALLSASDDEATIYVGRGAPRRWYSYDENSLMSPDAPRRAVFGLTNAPTRLARVSFSIAATTGSTTGWVALLPNTGSVNIYATQVAVKIRASNPMTRPIKSVTVVKGGATLKAWHPGNETAVFELDTGRSGAVEGTNFSFLANF